MTCIGVIGAGTMGNGIAQVFSTSGFEVRLVDVDAQRLYQGMEAMDASLGRLVKKEWMTSEHKDRVIASIRTSQCLDSLHRCEFIVEAVTENLAVKSDLLQKLDRICPDKTILASNTSSISLTRLAAQTARADRVIGMHFMNPVPLMKLVEVVRAYQTSEKTCQETEQLALKLGKTPVFVNDSPGFVSNRILVPMINEAIFALHEGIAEAEAIDEIMVLGMNHPIGPLALADLIGLDVVLSVLEVLQRGTGDPKFRPCPLLTKMVDANLLGRKTGQGFYPYP